MKKILLNVLFVCSVMLSYAQLPNNSVAPDFTANDINGNSHNLYAYLDSGYTVLIDLSATWCGPCWGVHQSGLLQNIHDRYGPNGTNEMRVFFIESEPTNTTAQLYGPAAGGGKNVNTKGDWVTGHTFPFIDDASIASAYQLSYYPTVYLICPERMTTLIDNPSTIDTATIHAMATNCNGIATLTEDPRTLEYTGDQLSYCGTFDASITIQNLGTNALTAATLQLEQGGNVLATKNWTGNIATYGTGTVNFGSITVTSNAPIEAKITSTDGNPNNNLLQSFTINILDVKTTDIANNMEDGTGSNLPSGVYYDKNARDFDVPAVSKSDFSTPPTQDVGGFGNSSKSLMFDFYGNQANKKSAVVLDRLTVDSAADSVRLEFSYAHAGYNGNEPDSLNVEISDDCGATWTSVFGKKGSALNTAGSVTSRFVPQANQWKKETIDLDSYKGKTILTRFTGISGYGNWLWLDDINITMHKTTTSPTEPSDPNAINTIEDLEVFSVYPSPAKNTLYVNVAFANTTDVVEINLQDIDGKIVKTITENNVDAIQNKAIDVSTLQAGIYFVEIKSTKGKAVRKVVIRN